MYFGKQKKKLLEWNDLGNVSTNYGKSSALTELLWIWNIEIRGKEKMNMNDAMA